MPVISVNKVVDKKRINGKRRAKEVKGTRGHCPPPQKKKSS
jgi:hypothetical protein